MITRALQHFRIEYGSDNITTVWIDVHDRSMNVFYDSVIEELEHVVDDLERVGTSDGCVAVVFRSAKRSGFFAGADVNQIAALKSRGDVEAVISRGQELFARIEGLSVPTVAAIHGPCLGGGLEFALACSHRIAMDHNSTRLGLPEVQLGLIPGWGGTQRLPKLIGLMNALPLVLQGKKLTAGSARNMGLVDVVGHEDSWDNDVAKFAANLVSASPRSWKKALVRKLSDSVPGRALVFRMASKRIARDARNYPALPAAVRSLRAAFDAGKDGYRVERDEFAGLVETETSRNLLKLFLRREKARSLRMPTPVEPSPDRISGLNEEQRNQSGADAHVKKLGVIGAGAMGAGIGQLAALKGIEVVFKELTLELAEAGMKRVTRLLDDMVSRKRLSPAERDVVLERISATDDYAALADCDLVIEAVVEKMDIKRGVFASLDAVLRPDAVIGSNTSALSVTEMAKATSRPDRVAGLHFFNPVHRMDLVEVVRTSNTNDQTVSMMLKLVRKLGKTPVVTSDSPGFLVNRVLFPYIGESIRMLLEGIDGREIDREVKRFGMPMGPIELIDHVGLDVAWHVASTLEHVLPESREVIRLLGQMVTRGWTGRKGGRGFYEYKNGKRGPATDLTDVIATCSRLSKAPFDNTTDTECVHKNVGEFLPDGLTDTQRRLVYPMINEVGFCMQENVVEEPWMADLAMILGTGFAPFRGGPMTMADGIGHATLLNNLHVLSARHGERFKPSAWLVNRRSAARVPVEV